MHYEIPDILDNQFSLNIIFLKCFIDFDKLTDTELQEICEQDYFFEKHTDYKIWCELDDLIEKIFSTQHTEIVNSVADDLTKKPHEKFEYISSKIFKLSSSRAKQLRLGRTNNIQYLDYELEIFQNAFEHSKNLVLYHKLIQMGENQITINGSVGQFNNQSTISNANVDMRTSDYETTINEIKAILKKLERANIDNKDWREALVKCISEFHKYKSLNSGSEKQEVSTKLNGLFIGLKEIKDKFDSITIPIDIYSKVNVLLEIWNKLHPI